MFGDHVVVSLHFGSKPCSRVQKDITEQLFKEDAGESRPVPSCDPEVALQVSSRCEWRFDDSGMFLSRGVCQLTGPETLLQG